MLEQTYLKWFRKEVAVVEYALLVALEKRDNLLYMEEPALKEEYMQKIGVYEEQALKLELEVSLQEKKKQMIQAAINRREPVDLEKMEQLLEEERTKQLERLNQTYKVGQYSDGTLTEEEKEELQKLHKEIVQEYHPQVHNDMTAYQKDLFQKALNAYKRKNLESLRLIHKMLFRKEENEGMLLELSLSVSFSKKTEEQDLEETVKKLMEDYSLAAELYSCFESLEEDAILIETKKRYEEKQVAVCSEIDMILNRFPFIAKQTLRDEDKLKDYLNSVHGRINSARIRLEELQKEIASMVSK